MKKYTNSVLALFICMLILTPSTVYAEELVNMPAFSIIQPITGAALANENLTDIKWKTGTAIYVYSFQFIFQEDYL